MTIRNPLARWATSMMTLAAVLAGCGLSPATTHMTSGGRLRVQGAEQVSSDISLLVMPNAGYQPLVQAINSAKKSVLLEMYILTYSGPTKEIVDALIAKSKAGLDVRVILEDQPYIPQEPGSTAPPINPNKPALMALTAANVRVKRSSPQFKYTHEKAMVIDGESAFVMTMNMSAAAFAKNREYIVIDQAPADVAEVANVFEADWSETPYVPLDPDLVVSPTNSKERILSLIDSASQSIDAQTEFIDDADVVSHLAAAQQRGVQVTMQIAYMRPDPKTGEDINAKEKATLAAAGITQVKAVKKPVMHAKMIAVDGVAAYVGSENFTTNSLTRNREMGVLVRDPGLVATLTQYARKDWAAN